LCAARSSEGEGSKKTASADDGAHLKGVELRTVENTIAATINTVAAM
jgi:hypothetical protein